MPTGENLTAAGEARVCTDGDRFPGCDDPGMRPRLVIVDDHAGFRASARRLLEAEGFSVVGEADDARSALPAVLAFAPDVVLLDIALPDGDGFDVCASIAREHTAPVVLTSSRTIAGLRDRLNGSRALGFISKSDLSGSALRDLMA